jgi:AcrR family transcriptional regulator
MASMGRKSRNVKATRSYDASLRRQQARRNHDRIVETAQRRFLRDGYGPTTISAIAADAGVSVDTIYKSFGGKAGLIRAMSARALEGTGPVPAEQRSDELQSRETNPRKLISRWGVLVTEIAPLAAPILLLVRDAASSHPELRRVVDEVHADRLRRMTDNARRFAAAGHLRPGLTVADAANVMWTYTAPELYELLVLRRGMPLKTFGRFVAEAMIAALL